MEILDFPDEVLLAIMSHLDTTWLYSISKTCVRLNRLAIEISLRHKMDPIAAYATSLLEDDKRQLSPVYIADLGKNLMRAVPSILLSITSPNRLICIVVNNIKSIKSLVRLIADRMGHKVFNFAPLTAKFVVNGTLSKFLRLIISRTSHDWIDVCIMTATLFRQQQRMILDSKFVTDLIFVDFDIYEFERSKRYWMVHSNTASKDQYARDLWRYEQVYGNILIQNALTIQSQCIIHHITPTQEIKIDDMLRDDVQMYKGFPDIENAIIDLIRSDPRVLIVVTKDESISEITSIIEGRVEHLGKVINVFADSYESIGTDIKSVMLFAQSIYNYQSRICDRYEYAQHIAEYFVSRIRYHSKCRYLNIYVFSNLHFTWLKHSDNLERCRNLLKFTGVLK